MSSFQLEKCLILFISPWFPAVEMRNVEKPRLKIINFQLCHLTEWSRFTVRTVLDFYKNVNHRTSCSLSCTVCKHSLNCLFKSEILVRMSVQDNYNHNLLVTDVKILVITMIKMMIILIIIITSVLINIPFVSGS